MPIDLSKFEQLKATGDLPSPRGVALAIIRLAEKDDATLLELTRVVRSDPAFVGRLIKAANSVVGGGRRPIVSVQEALMVLGLPAVRNMALGFSLISHYRDGRCHGFDYAAFWSGSLALALAAQGVVQRTRAAAADEMFSLGLLCRTGELALATLYPREYAGVLDEYRRSPQVRLTELEQRAFAMDHRELTAAMLADWGVPRIFTEPAFMAEEPERAGFADGSRQYGVLHALVLGRQIADVCLAGELERGALMGRVFEHGSLLNLDVDAMVSLCERVGKEWSEWGELLKLETPDAPDFAELAEIRLAEMEGQPARDDAQADAASAAQLGGDPVTLRVLVADGDDTLRGELRQGLEQAGHQVADAVDGHQAMERALEFQPHIMLVDLDMPGGNSGVDVVRALRSTRFGRTVYVLMLSAREDDASMVDAFESGVDDFITKPVHPRVLAARLRAGQRVVRLQQELERDREEIRHFAAELAVSNRRLQEAALTDPLTGFPNRRYAIERIQQEWAASLRTHRPLSCMVIDLDNFKHINDTHGHDAGDRVLCAAAAAFKQAVRAQDVIARTGGDEFLVICPETSLEAALLVGERLRVAVDALRVQVGSELLSLSISVGVAMRDTAMADPDALIKRADQGTYVAKDRGRNRVASVQLQR